MDSSELIELSLAPAGVPPVVRLDDGLTLRLNIVSVTPSWPELRLLFFFPCLNKHVTTNSTWTPVASTVQFSSAGVVSDDALFVYACGDVMSDEVETKHATVILCAGSCPRALPVTQDAEFTIPLFASGGSGPMTTLVCQWVPGQTGPRVEPDKLHDEDAKFLDSVTTSVAHYYHGLQQNIGMSPENAWHTGGKRHLGFGFTSPAFAGAMTRGAFVTELQYQTQLPALLRLVEFAAEMEPGGWQQPLSQHSLLNILSGAVAAVPRAGNYRFDRELTRLPRPSVFSDPSGRPLTVSFRDSAVTMDEWIDPTWLPSVQEGAFDCEDGAQLMLRLLWCLQSDQARQLDVASACYWLQEDQATLKSLASLWAEVTSAARRYRFFLAICTMEVDRDDASPSGAALVYHAVVLGLDTRLAQVLKGQTEQEQKLLAQQLFPAGDEALAPMLLLESTEYTEPLARTSESPMEDNAADRVFAQLQRDVRGHVRVPGRLIEQQRQYRSLVVLYEGIKSKGVSFGVNLLGPVQVEYDSVGEWACVSEGTLGIAVSQLRQVTVQQLRTSHGPAHSLTDVYDTATFAERRSLNSNGWSRQIKEHVLKVAARTPPRLLLPAPSTHALRLSVPRDQAKHVSIVYGLAARGPALLQSLASMTSRQTPGQIQMRVVGSKRMPVLEGVEFAVAAVCPTESGRVELDNYDQAQFNSLGGRLRQRREPPRPSFSAQRALDNFVGGQGVPVQCTRCRHTFQLTPDNAPSRDKGTVRCPSAKCNETAGKWRISPLVAGYSPLAEEDRKEARELDNRLRNYQRDQLIESSQRSTGPYADQATGVKPAMQTSHSQKAGGSKLGASHQGAQPEEVKGRAASERSGQSGSKKSTELPVDWNSRGHEVFWSPDESVFQSDQSYHTESMSRARPAVSELYRRNTIHGAQRSGLRSIRMPGTHSRVDERADAVEDVHGVMSTQQGYESRPPRQMSISNSAPRGRGGSMTRGRGGDQRGHSSRMGSGAAASRPVYKVFDVQTVQFGFPVKCLQMEAFLDSIDRDNTRAINVGLTSIVTNRSFNVYEEGYDRDDKVPSGIQDIVRKGILDARVAYPAHMDIGVAMGGNEEEILYLKFDAIIPENPTRDAAIFGFSTLQVLTNSQMDAAAWTKSSLPAANQAAEPEEEQEEEREEEEEEEREEEEEEEREEEQEAASEEEEEEELEEV